MGGRVRQLRWARGLRQRDLAAWLQISGWNASRVAVLKIESRLRCVADYELLQLAKALGVPVADLFPEESLFPGSLSKPAGNMPGCLIQGWQSAIPPPEKRNSDGPT